MRRFGCKFPIWIDYSVIVRNDYHLTASKEAILSEYIEEKTIQRIVIGREGGDALMITNLDGEVQFSVRGASVARDIQIVSLTWRAFASLLDKLLTMDVEARHQISSEKPKQKDLLLTNKSALPENIDEFGPTTVGSPPKRIKKSDESKTLRVWTDEDKKKLQELVESGLDSSEIAKILDRTDSSIKNKIGKIKISKIVLRKHKTNITGKKVKNAFGPWMPDETDDLVKRVLAGESNESISRAIGRSEISVRDRKRSKIVMDLLKNATPHLNEPELDLEENNGENG